MFGPDFCVHGRLATPNVCLCRLDHFRALEDLPEGEQDEENWNTHVGREEIGKLRRSPWSCGENFEAVEQDDQSEVSEGYPRSVRLPYTLENKGIAVDTLGDKRLAELDVGKTHTAPGEELGNGGQVLEPCEDAVCSGADAHVCEQRD